MPYDYIQRDAKGRIVIRARKNPKSQVVGHIPTPALERAIRDMQAGRFVVYEDPEEALTRANAYAKKFRKAR